MNDKELKAAAKAAFAANPEVGQYYQVATGDCFANELDARHAARQLDGHERWVRVVTRPGAKTETSDAAPVGGAPGVGDGASVDANGVGGAGPINADDAAGEAADGAKQVVEKAAVKKPRKKK